MPMIFKTDTILCSLAKCEKCIYRKNCGRTFEACKGKFFFPAYCGYCTNETGSGCSKNLSIYNLDSPPDCWDFFPKTVWGVTVGARI
jgi:hypothetical protein